MMRQPITGEIPHIGLGKHPLIPTVMSDVPVPAQDNEDSLEHDTGDLAPARGILLGILIGSGMWALLFLLAWLLL